MNDERLKQAYERMSPDANAEERILNGILMKGHSYMESRFTSQPVRSNRWAMIPAAVALIVVIALGVFVAVRFDRNGNTANDPTQEHDTVPNMITEPDTNLEPEESPDNGDSPEPMTIPSYGERPPHTVYPMQQVDINNIENCTIAVYVHGATNSVYGDEIKVEVYTYDVYDMVDISMLQVGDTIMIDSQPVLIRELECFDDYVDINGGYLGEGYTLATEENGVYYEFGVGGERRWQSIGVVDLPVSPDFIFTDNSDHANPGVVYTIEDIVDDVTLRGVSSFTPYNTTIVIEDGVVTEMIRRALP